MNLYFSNAGRWMQCARAVQRPARAVTFNLDIAAEGIAAHWVIERVLFGDAHSTLDFEGEVAPNGTSITDEMIQCADEYIEFFQRLFAQAKECGTEHRASLHGARGRIDVFARTDDVLTVGEFKYGFRRTPVEDNWQLILAALSQHQGEAHIQFIVYEPRADASEPWKSHVISRLDLEEYGRRVHARIIELEMGERGAVAGKHCHHCPLAADCDALGTWIEEHMDTTDLKELYQLQRLIKTRVTSIEADTEARIMSGEYIPGWQLAPRTGNRKFRVDRPMIEMATGKRAVKEVELSPNELQQMGVPKKTIDSLCYRPFAGYKLQPWSAKDAAKLFEENNT